MLPPEAVRSTQRGHGAGHTGPSLPRHRPDGDRKGDPAHRKHQPERPRKAPGRCCGAQPKVLPRGHGPYWGDCS
nr:MAG TPA: hypothetical protein [Caudoviricetes sp.]